jgi:hypothetical protein
LFFTDSPQLLDREPAGQFALLLDLLEKTARKWNQTEKGGSGSAPRPFHVVFQCSPEDEAALLARFERHGRSLNRLK